MIPRPAGLLALALLFGCGSQQPSTSSPATTSFRDASPRWSPDGSKIAFLRIYDERRTQLFIADADLRNPRPLSAIDSVRWARPPITGQSARVAPDAPSWSPDGRRIAVSRGERLSFDGKRTIGGTALWTYDVDSGGATPLAVHPAGYDGDLQFYRAPAWSPDGRHIAFMAEGVYGYASLVVHTLGATATDEQTPVIDMLDDYGWPSWSPDGRWLAFRQSLFRSESALPVEVVRFIAPGMARARTVVIKSPRPNELWRATHLAWAPDSSSLAVRVHTAGMAETARPCIISVDARTVKVGREGAGVLSHFWTGSRLEKVMYRFERAGSSFVTRGSGGWDGASWPSDDLEFSPDGRLAVFHEPARIGLAALTTLRSRSQ